MLMISSLTLLISILPLFVAACLDPRFQDEQTPFVTVPLVERNLTLPNGALDIKAARRSILAARRMNRKNAINLKRRMFTEKIISMIFKKKGHGELDYTAINDAPYAGQITIGNPPQTFSVGFATASSISQIGIPDPHPKLGKYKEKNVYMADKSHTYKHKGKFQRLDIFSDKFTFANIKVRDQYFFGVPSFDPSRPQDGTIALGFQGSQAGAPPTFMDNALAQGQIKQRIFGVSFAPGKREFHFGGMNKKLYTNPIEYHEVIQLRDDKRQVLPYWALGNAQVYVGDLKVLDGLKTIISTDSLFTWGPRNKVDEFYKSIPGLQVKRGGHNEPKGMYKFPCSSWPKVKLSWDDKEPWEYSGFNTFLGPHKPSTSSDSEDPMTMCYGAIAAYDLGSGEQKEEEWWIGTSFLKSVYTGFINTSSPPKVMFAKIGN